MAKNLRWEKTKNEVLNNCKKAGITDKEFIKAVLKVERTIETCKNDLYVRRRSWEYVCNSDTYYYGLKAMDSLNGSFLGEAKFLDLWKIYCEPIGISWESTMGDWMA